MFNGCRERVQQRAVFWINSSDELRTFPRESMVALSIDGAVRYDDVVHLVDACRGAGFRAAFIDLELRWQL